MNLKVPYTTKKPTKAQAFDIIKKLAKGKILDEAETSKLLLYFAPPAGARPKTAFEWVSKATAKGKLVHWSRSKWKCVRVEQGRIIASDGHRLHIAKAPEGLKTGWYLPGKEPIKTDLPDWCYDWRPVVDGIENGDWHEMPTDPPQHYIEDKLAVQIGGLWIQRQYLDAAAPDEYRTDKNRLICRNRWGLAVIMAYEV